MTSTHMLSRMPARPPLSEQDLACFHELISKPLHPKTATCARAVVLGAPSASLCSCTDLECWESCLAAARGKPPEKADEHGVWCTGSWIVTEMALSFVPLDRCTESLWNSNKTKSNAMHAVKPLQFDSSAGIEESQQVASSIRSTE
jgi:hypothetical protein